MRFHVLGLGSIGSLLSHHLRLAVLPTNTITLIHRTHKQARDAMSHGGVIHVESQGLVSTASGFKSEPFETYGRKKTENHQGLKEIQKAHSIESLFVTTKAHHTLPAIRRLLPHLSNNTTIVLMQNGMGIYEELVTQVFRNPKQRPHFILASNTHGAFRQSTFKVVHAGLGRIEFGIVPDPSGRDHEIGFLDGTASKEERIPRLADIMPPSDDPSFGRYASLKNTVAALLLMKPLNTSWKPISDVQTAMRRKLVANAVINPLTALMGCRNGDILRTEASRRIMRRVCQEGQDVFAAQLKAETAAWTDNLASTHTAAVRLPRALTAAMLEKEVQRVVKVTKGNISSMLTDIRLGKATEIGFINGYLLKLGSTYHTPMPATATLLNLVKMRQAIPLDQHI